MKTRLLSRPLPPLPHIILRLRILLFVTFDKLKYRTVSLSGWNANLAESQDGGFFSFLQCYTFYKPNERVSNTL